MKRVLGWVTSIALIWVFIMVATLFLLPRFGSWRFDAVLSGSMEPALSVGGVVVAKPVQPSDIGIGDIITFHSGETLVTHRIVEMINGQGQVSFITKGDANEEPDLSPVAAENVVGKVVFKMPFLGYLTSFVKTRLGLITTIFIPGLGIIILELKNMWQVVNAKEKV